MKKIAILNEDNRITNIILVADDADAVEFGGRELAEPQNIGDLYIRPKTLEEKIADLENDQQAFEEIMAALLGEEEETE